jgi:TatD DNase family protein
LQLVDAHAHLEPRASDSIIKSLEAKHLKYPEERITVFSNSVDLDTSNSNIRLSKEHPDIVVPFVGIHPQSISAQTSQKDSKEIFLQNMDELRKILPGAAGIGEIGLDPKYGGLEQQVRLLEMQLELAEDNPRLPLTFHSRETTERILDISSTFKLPNRKLFHWFSGTRETLSRLQSLGAYVSFGPAAIFSGRLSELVAVADKGMILSETDSPLVLSSLSRSESVSPFVVASVVFRIAQIKNWSFENASEVIAENSNGFLQAQNSLRLNSA